MDTMCAKSECTIGQTGICLLNHPPDECPNRINIVETRAVEGLAPVLEAPNENVRFTSSLALSNDALVAVASDVVCHQIGVLGFPAAGKTAALVSMYLLLAWNKLEGFSFRNSRTLMGFEQISRGARWNKDNIPDKLTVHTEIADGRSAGFLHFKLEETDTGKCHNYLIPDLPGEWTTSLVDEARLDRLLFLRASSAIWIFVDSRKLSDTATRNDTLHRTKRIIKRVKEILDSAVAPPVTLVFTHWDVTHVPEQCAQQLVTFGQTHGLVCTTVGVASFSPLASASPPGTGLADLLKRVGRGADDMKRPSVNAARLNGERAMWDFRGNADA
jgi:hypothetical protein